MKVFNVGDREFRLSETWDEINLGQYIRFCKLEQQKADGLFPVEELYMIKIYEILTNCWDGDLDDMEIDQLNDLVQSTAFLKKQLKKSRSLHFNIDGVDYAIKPDFNKLTMGEVVSLKTLQSDNDIYDVLAKMLAILIRPATKTTSKNGKTAVWVLEKLDPDTLNQRAELLSKKFKVSDLLGVIDFFLNGTKKSPKRTPTSLTGDKK